MVGMHGHLTLGTDAGWRSKMLVMADLVSGEGLSPGSETVSLLRPSVAARAREHSGVPL